MVARERQRGVGSWWRLGVGVGVVKLADAYHLNMSLVQIIAIDVNDRWASELNDIDDVERLLPGTLDTIREWFRTYKMYDGKPENK